MADKMGPDNPGTNPTADAPLDCEQWEALLADKMDGTLAPEVEAAFAEHSRLCPGCEGLLEQARQGQEWLKLLEEHVPAAPVHLLSRILAQTQGAGRERDYAIGTSGVAATGVAGHGPRWGMPAAALLAARGAHNARMVMTGAMAFFSVALTLSVAGVRLTSVHAAELRPQVVQASVSRSFYGTKKQVVSFYENLRLVYEVESKMHDLRHDADPAPVKREAVPEGTGTKPVQPKAAAPSGQATPRAHASSAGHAGDDTDRRPDNSKHVEEGEQVLHGWPLLVNYVPNVEGCLFHTAGSFAEPGLGAMSQAQTGGKQADQNRTSVNQAGEKQTSAVSLTMLCGATSKERNRT